VDKKIKAHTPLQKEVCVLAKHFHDKEVPTMFVSKRILFFITVACLLCAASFAYADAAAVARGIAEFKAASQELVRLYTSARDEASAKAAEAQINAATKRQNAAESALNAAIQKLNPNNQADGKIIENAYAEIQAANEAVSAAQLKAMENQEAAKAQKK
jgi:cytochrome c556